MPVTVNDAQRQALYNLIVVDLARLSDFPMVLSRDALTAQRFRREFEADARLLDDLGWEQGDERGSYEIRMTADDLRQLLERLHQQASGDLAELVADSSQASLEEAAAAVLAAGQMLERARREADVDNER